MQAQAERAAADRAGAEHAGREPGGPEQAGVDVALDPGVVEDAFRREVERNAARINFVRIFAAGLWCPLTFLNGWVAHQNISVGYLTLAVIVWLLGNRRNTFLRLSIYAPPFIDQTFFFAANYALVIRGASPDPTYVAGRSLLLGVIFVLTSTLSLRRPVIVASSVLAAALGMLMNRGAVVQIKGEVLLITVLYGVVAFLCLYTVQQITRLVRHGLAEQLRRERLGRYFAPAVASQILKEGNPGILPTEEVSVLFADIRGFTSLSEHLDGSRVVMLLNEHHSAMVEVVFRHNGILDKFLGDGVLVWFGAPVQREGHAGRAVACAMEMIAVTEGMNAQREARGDPPITIGVGVHSGPVIIGNIGSVRRQEFTIVGDTVNVASRIEHLTKDFSVPVLVSESTRALVPDTWTFEPKPPILVRGKAEAVATYVPVRRVEARVKAS